MLVTAITRQCLTRMIAFRVSFSRTLAARYFSARAVFRRSLGRDLRTACTTAIKNSHWRTCDSTGLGLLLYDRKCCFTDRGIFPGAPGYAEDRRRLFEAAVQDRDGFFWPWCFPHSLLRDRNMRAAEKANRSCRIYRPCKFFGMNGHALLLIGLSSASAAFCSVRHLCAVENAPVHRSMLEISELIYETCETYLMHAGQVHHAALLGSSSRLSFRCTLDGSRRYLENQWRYVAHHPALFARGHRGQLRCWRGSDSRQHVCLTTNSVFSIARQAVSDHGHSAEGTHEHRPCC